MPKSASVEPQGLPASVYIAKSCESYIESPAHSRLCSQLGDAERSRYGNKLRCSTRQADVGKSHDDTLNGTHNNPGLKIGPVLDADPTLDTYSAPVVCVRANGLHRGGRCSPVRRAVVYEHGASRPRQFPRPPASPPDHADRGAHSALDMSEKRQTSMTTNILSLRALP